MEREPLPGGDGRSVYEDHTGQSPAVETQPQPPPPSTPPNRALAPRPDNALISGRPHSISAASATSDDVSDIFSSYDSRRSTVSSVYSDATWSSPGGSGDSNNTSPQHHQQQLLQGSPLARSRGNAKQLHQARLLRQRAESNASTTTCEDDGNSSSPLRRKRGASRKYKTANPQAALAATEPPHEQLLTKMAFAEQQRWITVQQKTFTKWLNTKIETRGLEVVDLVKDLSDGVSASSTRQAACWPLLLTLANFRSC